MSNSNTEKTGKLEELQKKIQDLTDSLAQAHQRLSDAEKMVLLGQLVSGIAHEINTPLGALRSNHDLFIRYFGKIRDILFSLEAAEEIRGNQTLKQMLENIDELNQVNKAATERIVEIVNGVRRYARQDETEAVKTDIPENLENTLTLVRHELKNRIKIYQEYRPVPPVSGYPNLLSQVFLNLLVNACQAIEDTGEIFIKTYEKNGMVVIEIGDNGKGISAEKQEQIFQAGFTTKSTGMGMGLSIVKQIIEDHHGRIEVNSEENKGTTFRIYLPAAG